MDRHDSDRAPVHILIYGPPAAGKLTVATAVAERYGPALVDNHATIDIGLRLFQFGDPDMVELVKELRIAVLYAAARASRNIVTTLVVNYDNDLPYVEELVNASAAGGAITHFVQLTAPPDVLGERVTAASRQTTTKIKDLEVLTGILERCDLDTPVNATDLRIDTSTTPVDEAVTQIGAHAGLDRIAAPAGV